MRSERAPGAPLVQGNSHGIGVNAIVRIRASGAMRSAYSSTRGRERPNRAKFEKACADDDRKAPG